MKSKQLAQLIRKLVKEEVQKQVRSVLAEQSAKNASFMEMQQPAPEFKEAKKFTANSALNDILNETVQSTDYDTLKTFNSSDARAGFAAMQGPMGSNPIPDKDISGAPMNPSKVTPDLMKALTRDYSELVKRF
jgi:anthranilate phosphoribosyltransferase